MNLANQERVLEAIKKIQSLSTRDIDRQIDLKVGDAMMAGFALVARDLFGDGPDDALIAQRVQLMLYAYLLCCEINRDFEPPTPDKGRPKRSP